MSSDLIRYASPSPDEYKMMAQQAQDMIDSGFLPRAIDKPQKALAIMMKGRELNLPPWVALSNIHIIEGKPTLSADLMAALVQRAIDQKGDGELTSLPPTDKQATVRYRRWGQSEPQEYTFTMQDAAAAGLTGRGPWKAHPKSMMRARALAHACRAGFPDVVAGMYDPDELQQENAAATPNLDPVSARIVRETMAISPPPVPTEVIDGEYVDKTTGEISANNAVDPNAPATKDLKQWVWNRAKEVFGDEGRVVALHTLLHLEHEGTPLPDITIGMAHGLIDSMDDPEGVRAYVASMAEGEPEPPRDADEQLEDTQAQTVAWQDTLNTTPPSRWSSLYDEAFQEPWKVQVMIDKAPSIGALKMIEGQAKKRGQLERFQQSLDLAKERYAVTAQ